MGASQRSAVACFVAVCLAASGCGREEDTPPPVESPAPVAAPIDGHIDPTPYRAEIQATEAVLYSDQAPGEDGWKSLSRALLELHNAIVFRDTSMPARETGRRLLVFSAQVDAGGAPKRVEEERAVMRGVWEKIRAEQFAQADWFHTASR